MGSGLFCCCRRFLARVGPLLCGVFLLAMAASFAARVSQAQSVPGVWRLDADRLPMVALDGQWRFHPGDNPRWADPAFNDSDWKLLKSTEPWTVQGYPGMSGFAWYRFRVWLPADHRPVALGLNGIMTGYQVFADGRLQKTVGPLSRYSLAGFSFGSFDVPLALDEHATDRSVVIAIRVYQTPLWANYVGGGPQSGGSLYGDASLVQQEVEHHNDQSKLLIVDQYAYSIAAALIGLMVLGLFVFRPAEREYLWFAIVVLAQAADASLTVVHHIFSTPTIPIFDFLDSLLGAVGQIALMLFMLRVLRRSAGLGWWILVSLLAISPVVSFSYWFTSIPVPVAALAASLLALPSSLWMIAVLVKGSLRGEVTSRLLLLPVLLREGLSLADNVVLSGYQLGLPIDPYLLEVSLITIPFRIHTLVLVRLVFLLAMAGFLIRRFTIARRREERLESALDAAQQVQRLLVPEAKPQIPGFDITCVYRPADSVGGDFYQIVPLADGGLFLIIGDVAGKGLPAAMMVSMLLGVFRAEISHTEEPGELLTRLNEHLVGRSLSKLTTCLCASIARDGTMVIASAGHLSPYRNGDEVALNGSLPLGLAAGIHYESAKLTLASGDRLTFVSDGVVEAQSAKGELLGFEQTARLSVLPAALIADGAQAFGQEDDITVVTVAYLPQAARPGA